MTTTLLVSPDYRSHFEPLASVADLLRERGDRVVVATGEAMTPAAHDRGVEVCTVRLAPGSNDGVADRATFDRTDASALDQFVDATRSGFVATLAHQARARRHELLWRPEVVVRELLDVAARVGADRMVVDQVSLVSTLAARASGLPFVTFVPGHPTQLPVAGERYGDAIAWPQALAPDRESLVALGELAAAVDADLTAVFNSCLASCADGVAAVDSAFAVHGDVVLYRWEESLHDPLRRGRLPNGRADLGPMIDPAVGRAHRSSSERPLVVVSLGTFLAHRDDVLARCAAALRTLPVRAAIAVGPHDPAQVGAVPDDWLVVPWLPQRELLAEAEVLITHGGNGSVQEALANGTRLVVLPMSTDQPAIAADLERTGRGVALDPNALDADFVASVVADLLATPRPDPVQVDAGLALDRALFPPRV